MAVSADIVSRFGIADYVVFILMLVISAAIGVYYACSGGRQNTTKEFLMGNKALGVFPVSMSVLASFMSAIGLLGIPAEIYQFNTQFFAIAASYLLVMPATAYLFTPIFYRLQLTSAYEYLEKRFNRFVRTLGSTMFSIQMIIYMAIVLYAPALALSQVTGLHVWFSVLSIGIVCTFYTTIGGIKAVVWTDLFQVVMMFASMLAIVIKGAIDVGGFSYVWQKNVEGGRIEFFNFDTDVTVRHTVWSLAIGGYFNWVAVYGCNQAMVQRYLTLPSLKAAQKTIWLNLPGLSLLLVITCFAGLVIYAKYWDCDPILTKQVAAPDQLFPLFVMDTLGFLPGLPGLFVSGIFSGALSTVSSGVNSLAAVTLEDVIRAYIRPDISDLWATRITKILALSYGIIAIILVVVAQKMGNVLQAAISIFGLLGGPLLGLFTLGIFFPWANSSGAAVGLFSALALSLWIGIGKFIYKPYVPKATFSVEGCQDLYLNTTGLFHTNSTKFTFVSPPTIKQEVLSVYKVSYMWYSVIGCVATVVIGLLVSACTGANKPDEVEPSLISPLVRKFYECLPGFIRKKMKLWNDSETSRKKGTQGERNLSYVSSVSEMQAEKKEKKITNSATNHTVM